MTYDTASWFFWGSHIYIDICQRYMTTKTKQSTETRAVPKEVPFNYSDMIETLSLSYPINVDTKRSHTQNAYRPHW